MHAAIPDQQQPGAAHEQLQPPLVDSHDGERAEVCHGPRSTVCLGNRTGRYRLSRCVTSDVSRAIFNELKGSRGLSRLLYR